MPNRQFQKHFCGAPIVPTIAPRLFRHQGHAQKDEVIYGLEREITPR